MLIMKSSENDFISLPAFHLIMCLMKAPKDFLKIVIFQNMTACFLLGCQNSLCIKKIDCNQYYDVAFDPFKI